jgi:hypothetical protein
MRTLVQKAAEPVIAAYEMFTIPFLFPISRAVPTILRFESPDIPRDTAVVFPINGRPYAAQETKDRC